MNEGYLYVIVALLPIAASMVVVQKNPYHALVIRGILGAIAALVYAVLGAADVALTEALVGTMLAITLYAVAVRSSLVMRLGVLEEEAIALEKQADPQAGPSAHLGSLVNALRTFLRNHYMRLEIVPYATSQTMYQGLMDKAVHAVCVRRSPAEVDSQPLSEGETDQPIYQTTVRIQRLYDLMQAELPTSLTHLTYVQTPSNETVSAASTIGEVKP